MTTNQIKYALRLCDDIRRIEKRAHRDDMVPLRTSLHDVERYARYSLRRKYNIDLGPIRHAL